MSVRSLARRLSVYGDCLTRLMEWGVRNCPSWLEPLFAGIWSAVFFVLCRQQRRAVVANLRAMFPEWSAARAHAGAFRVIWNFAWSMIDATRVSGGQDVVDWELDGFDHFRELAASEGGAIVLTAHMGNYDLAAPVFAERFGRRVNAVRAPEREEALQEHFEKRRAGEQSGSFAVRYNREAAMIGVELASLLGQGEVVALQGDRVLFDVSPATAEMFGRDAVLPRGPFALALASGAPLWPLFIVRDGWRRYRIRVGGNHAVRADRAQRAEAMAAAIAWWAGELETVLRTGWYQWFVFEEVFQSGEEGAS